MKQQLKDTLKRYWYFLPILFLWVSAGTNAFVVKPEMSAKINQLMAKIWEKDATINILLHKHTIDTLRLHTKIKRLQRDTLARPAVLIRDTTIIVKKAKVDSMKVFQIISAREYAIIEKLRKGNIRVKELGND